MEEMELEDYEKQPLNYPKTVEEALRVLRREAARRKDPEYIKNIKAFIDDNMVPCDDIQYKE